MKKLEQTNKERVGKKRCQRGFVQKELYGPILPIFLFILLLHPHHHGYNFFASKHPSFYIYLLNST